MSSSSSDIGNIRLIDRYIETDNNLPHIASKPHTLPLKHDKCVQKELEDLEKARIIQQSPPLMPL